MESSLFFSLVDGGGQERLFSLEIARRSCPGNRSMIKRWVGPRRFEFTSETRLIYDAYTEPLFVDPRSIHASWRRIEGARRANTRYAKLIVILVGRIINSQSASVSGWMLSRIVAPLRFLPPLWSARTICGYASIFVPHTCISISGRNGATVSFQLECGDWIVVVHRHT